MQSSAEIVIEVPPTEARFATQQTEILKLCSASYQENFKEYLDLLPSPIHIVARHAGILVSHAVPEEQVMIYRLP